MSRYMRLFSLSTLQRRVAPAFNRPSALSRLVSVRDEVGEHLFTLKNPHLRAEYTHPKTHHDVRNLTKQEWEKRLTPEQFSVCREQCTEPPFSGEYVSHNEPGVYNCVCCGVTLFGSEAKYDSRTGWPSFYSAYKDEKGQTNVIERPENIAERMTGTFRTEVICKKCDSHLGHVFDDGPPPTGRRYCINSVALQFQEKET